MRRSSLPGGTAPDDTLAFLARGGETGALMARLDASSTPLGVPGGWPPSLRQAVSSMLVSRFPMFVAWGEDFPYLYNDACIPIVGERHPWALGRPFREVWPDVWPELSPLLREALDGHSSFRENLPLVLQRGGVPRPAWFTFSYSPLLDHTGTARGVLSVAVETTAAVLAEQQQAFRDALDRSLRDLTDPDRIMRVAADLLGTEIGVNRCGYGEVDEAAGTITIASEWNDGRERSLVGRHGLDILGDVLLGCFRAGAALRIDDVERDDRLDPDGRARLLALGARAAITLPLIKDGRIVAMIYVNQGAPRHWSDQDEAMVREVAERTWSAVGRARAELSLRQSEHELRALTDALPVLISYIDGQERYQFNNHAYESWFGVDRDEIRGKHISDVIGAEAYASLKPYVDRALSGEAFTVEQVVTYRGGDRKHVRVYYVPRRSEAGAVEGYYALVQDIGAEKAAEEALRLSQQRLSAVLESVSDGFYALDPDWRITLFNRASEAYFGMAREAVLGRDLWSLFPSAVGTDFERRYREIAAGGEPQTFEAPSAACAGRFVEIRAARKVDGGLAVSFSDVTERHKAEAHREILLNELNHRVRNTLALIQGLSAQSFRDGMTIGEAKQAFEGRLAALAAAHTVLTTENWTSASLRTIVEGVVRSFGDAGRFHIAGPDIRLPPKTSVSFALALHELGTNAVKYGALSVPPGRVGVEWSLARGEAGDRLLFEWRETGGPAVAPPRQRGFGSRMLERGLANELQGDVALQFGPAGLTCTIDAPLPAA